MNKRWLTFFVCFQSLCAWAQETITVVDNIKVNYEEGRGTFRWYGPVFSHEGSTLRSDSADYNEGDNFFDAFGNVVITQPDGTIVYADKLHYTEATRQALLTGNVRLVDQDAVLHTDYLTYNLNTKIGNYHGGGRIINQGDTLTSVHGYYFEKTKDAYFRKNVVVNTESATIYTDSMRYNSASKMTYFYGPTDIRGENGNLYTENGDYNTETKYARFGKNNLYTEGSKFLRGDSLLYDGQTGNGRAIKNVIFVDTAQHLVMRGQLGTYDKLAERTVMTDRAYIVLATEDGEPPPGDTTDIKDEHALSLKDTVDHDRIENKDTLRTDSIYMTADTLMSQVILLKDYTFANLNLDRSGGPIEADDASEVLEGFEDFGFDTVSGPVLEPPTPRLAADSADTAQIDSLQETDVDSVPPLADFTYNAADSTAIQDSIPLVGEADSTLRSATEIALGQNMTTDSIVSDTSKTRIVIAYHNVKIYKSDLQAIADSAYYGYPDSLIRCIGTPMIWSQGSQLTGDTVFLQLKNQKLDNMLLKGNAFIVNTELDSSRFNQIKGRRISGFFTNGKLDIVYVDGNAESIYHSVEEGQFTGMGRTLSGRIKLLFDDNKMSDVVWIKSFESTYYPIDQAPDDRSFLEGFVWKPELRPKSKEAILPSLKVPAKQDSAETAKQTDNDSPETKNQLIQEASEVSENPDKN